MFSGNNMPMEPFTGNNFLANPVSAQNHTNTHSIGNHDLKFQYSNQKKAHFNVEHDPIASGPVDITAKLQEHEWRIKQLMDENAALQANYARMAEELGMMRAQKSRYNTVDYDNSEGSLSGASASAILSETSFDSGPSLSEMSLESQGLSHTGPGMDSEMEELATFLDGQLEYGPPGTNSVPLNQPEDPFYPEWMDLDTYNHSNLPALDYSVEQNHLPINFENNLHASPMEDINTSINAPSVQERMLPPSLPPTMPPKSPPPPPEPLTRATSPSRPIPETSAPLVSPSTALVTSANVTPSDGLSTPPPSPESNGHEHDSPERSTSPATTASPVTPISTSPVVIDFTSYRCSRPFGEEIKTLLTPETADNDACSGLSIASHRSSTDSESMPSGLIGEFFIHRTMDLDKDGQPTVACLLCAERKVEHPVFFAHSTPPKYLEDHCRRKHLGDWVRYHAGWGRIDT